MLDEHVEVIKEGKVKIIKTNTVFYNKVQEFNRDLSVLAVNTFLKNELWTAAKKLYIKDKITILDALSATGLRSIRYSLECSHDQMPIEIFANDISDEAIKTIEKNISLNDSYNVIVTQEDASMLMYKKFALNERLSIIDLDPYGSPISFLDAAIQSIVDGGLLMITSTDMAVLCGNYGEVCFAKYGSYPVKGKFCHEMALRILIFCVNSHANRYGRYVVPLLSLSIDFYIRAFFQVFTSRSESQKCPRKVSYIYVCKGCESFSLQPLSQKKSHCETFGPSDVLFQKQCQLCEQTLQIGGPIWSDPIYCPNFVEMMKKELDSENRKYDFGTLRRMKGMLQVISEELNDVPLYYQLDRLCCLANCQMPTIKKFRSAIVNSGYRVSYSHALKNSIKTDASNEFIWSIIKKLNESQKITLKSPIKNIFDKIVSKNEINFNLIDEEPKSKNLGLLRYQVNPEVNWGPKSRPQISEKRLINSSEGDQVKKRRKEKILKT